MARTEKPDAATPPAPEPPSAALPNAPTHFRVLFAPIAKEVIAPIEAAGKWWHHGTYHVLEAAVAHELAKLPHFSILGPADPPTTKKP